MSNKKNRWILLIILAIIVLCIFTHSWLKTFYQSQVIDKQKVTVDIYRNTLEAALARFDYLPHVLSQNNKLFEQAFVQPELASKSLAAFKESSKVDVIFIMDQYGKTIASSNWDQENSFVDKVYGYRPYFKQALKQQKGQFFGVGATTNIPGYFVSAPYRSDNQVKAVIVVKVLLSSIIDSWSTRTKDDEIVFVTDENQIIILSSKDEWLYNSLVELNDSQKQAIREQKQFGNNFLPLLDIVKKEASQELTIEDEPYIQSVASPNVMNWKINYLIPSHQISNQLLTFWSRVFTLLLVGLAVLLTIRGINHRAALRQSQGESSALRKLNLTLETEIEERKQIEAKLRAAQTELRRTSKLAAMGQLSASITHEIGQPLAAMRTYIANMTMAQQQLEKNKNTANSISTLGKLDQLVNRMTSITQQLRYFARSGDRETQPLDLRKAISGALNTVLPSIEEAKINFDLTQNKEPVMVEAGRVRLEQVIVNVLKNAMEAILETPINEKWIKLSLVTDTDKAILTIDDSGPGVSAEIQKELFEPFVTTKASGVGMGLGLAISLNIIHELKGTLHVENKPEGGASFKITLPLINAKEDNNDY